MVIDVRLEISEVRRSLRAIGGDFDRIAASAINRTAFQVSREDGPRELERLIDEPTQQTKKSVVFRKASSSSLAAVIHFKPFAERYLLKLITRERQIGKAVPADIRLNRFGNIPGLRGGNKINVLVRRKNHFRATINGLDAVWKRVGRGKAKKIRPVIMFSVSIQPREKLDIIPVLRRHVRRRVRSNVDHEIRRAIERKWRR